MHVCSARLSISNSTCSVCVKTKVKKTEFVFCLFVCVYKLAGMCEDCVCVCALLSERESKGNFCVLVCVNAHLCVRGCVCMCVCVFKLACFVYERSVFAC